MEEFLQAGKQTQITSRIKEITDAIVGVDYEFILKLLKWINKNIRYPAPEGVEKNDVFRLRTADQIVKDGFATGCTDFALVFIAVARAKGVPTRYVEAIAKDYFSDDPDKVRGHIFAECYINGDWWGVDPMAGNLKAGIKYPGYVVYGRGLDSWDMGIRDIKTMREKFRQFANEYTEGRQR